VETTCSPDLDATPRRGQRNAPAAISGEVTLSVIIVSWNVRDLLRDCLRSLYGEMELTAGRWEIIVVDNASADGSAEMVHNEFANVCVLANSENAGFAKANNQALTSCRGEFILLLNPDTVVQDHAVDRMLRIMQAQPEIGALGCRLLNTDGSLQRWT